WQPYAELLTLLSAQLALNPKDRYPKKRAPNQGGATQQQNGLPKEKRSRETQLQTQGSQGEEESQRGIQFRGRRQKVSESPAPAAVRQRTRKGTLRCPPPGSRVHPSADQADSCSTWRNVARSAALTPGASAAVPAGILDGRCTSHISARSPRVRPSACRGRAIAGAGVRVALTSTNRNFPRGPGSTKSTSKPCSSRKW